MDFSDLIRLEYTEPETLIPPKRAKREMKQIPSGKNLISKTRPPKPSTGKVLKMETETRSPASKFLVPASENAMFATEFTAPATEFTAPAAEFTAPAAEFTAPAQQFPSPAPKIVRGVGFSGGTVENLGGPIENQGSGFQRTSPNILQIPFLPVDEVNLQMGFHPASGGRCIVISQQTQQGNSSFIYLKTQDIPAMVYTLVEKMMNN
jgi:hypothetical protein